MTTKRSDFFIDGKWRTYATDTVDIVSPNDGKVLSRTPLATAAVIDAAVSAARQAMADPHGWSRLQPAERAAKMNALADALDRRAGDLAAAVSAQNGMPISIANGLEAVFPQTLLRYYAGLIENFDFEEMRPGLLGGSTKVQRRPVGVVAAIVPWNFPQALAAFKYAPALAAGCAIVIKPSPETTLDSDILAEAVAEAGIPPGVINIVPGDHTAGEYLVSHPGVDKVAFTGSTQVGRRIAGVCGELLRPVTLKLGGKSAAIFLDDADLDLQRVGEQMFSTMLLNNGQTCFLSSRILAPRARYAEIVDLVTTLVSVQNVGNSLDPQTTIGPLATSRQRDRVEQYIEIGRSEGARVTTGGGRPDSAGWFMTPTVFADVDNRHRIAREEIFGPVLSVIPYDGDDDAIAIANDSEYGLAGVVFTTDHARGMAMADRIESGSVGINGYLPDPTAPFGGIKASGLGQELGPEALTGYLTYKSIYA
ncbi:putative aldehyde dehydrogenase [Gordonia paraffinivorans NBRC 108238]|uniref:Aldehyde dehydrogenase n=1 Tax=Gordonia paraffinivorans NBRC 108238 TaxID=1223543 RepID=A0ABQ0IME9_9ACTN|nr:aldehyde dehydrogenase [Gordonia paraffinivorans]GAC84650.1 putative aldehyde dehydrogenase [Gordonia paraffinivorans NBRC 108238]